MNFCLSHNLFPFLLLLVLLVLFVSFERADQSGGVDLLQLGLARPAQLGQLVEDLVEEDFNADVDEEENTDQKGNCHLNHTHVHFTYSYTRVPS